MSKKKKERKILCALYHSNTTKHCRHSCWSNNSSITFFFYSWELRPWTKISDPQCQCAHRCGEEQWTDFQEYLLKGEEKSTSKENEDKREVEDPCLFGHHHPPIAVEFISTWEGLPLPLLWGLFLVRGLHRCGAASAYLAVLALSHGLWYPEMHWLHVVIPTTK